MEGSDPGRQVEAFRRRLEAMGLDCRELPAGSSLLVRLRPRGGPLPTPEGELPVPQIVFATVGANRIKCLVPRALFHLPLLGVADCDSAGAVESRIRQAWRERQGTLHKTREWLEKLGCEVGSWQDAPVAFVPVGPAEKRGQIAATEPGAVVLPGAGLLEGVMLHRPEDRIVRPDADIESAVDLELAVSSRADELVHMDARLQQQKRLVAMAAGPVARLQKAPRHHNVLLVGRHLLGDTGLIESLRVRGYRVTVVRGAAEALRAFDTRSFELMLVESELDRFEGIEMVPTVRALPGIEELPIVLVDTRLRTELRDTARQVGAAGYVTHPIDVPLIEDGIARLVESPRRRRFSRFDHRLGVQAAGAARSEVAHEISRGGMLLLTEREVAPRALQRFALALPDGGGPMRVDTEVVYRMQAQAGSLPRVGVRFERFPDNDEQRLIAFLTSLKRS
jgi:two-component system chemotaxis response regulator CheY